MIDNIFKHFVVRPVKGALRALNFIAGVALLLSLFIFIPAWFASALNLSAWGYPACILAWWLLLAALFAVGEE